MSVLHHLREHHHREFSITETEHLFGYDYIMSLPNDDGSRMLPVHIMTRQRRMIDWEWDRFRRAAIMRAAGCWASYVSITSSLAD